MRAFIIDTVNFNNNGSDQPIGAWDYEKVGFDLYNSIMQYRNTKFHFKYTSPKSFLFPLYNSDFLKTKQYFNLGLDFFLYSSTFLDMDFSHTQMQDTAFIVGSKMFFAGGDYEPLYMGLVLLHTIFYPFIV